MQSKTTLNQLKKKKKRWKKGNPTTVTKTTEFRQFKQNPPAQPKSPTLWTKKVQTPTTTQNLSKFKQNAKKTNFNQQNKQKRKKPNNNNNNRKSKQNSPKTQGIDPITLVPLSMYLIANSSSVFLSLTSLATPKFPEPSSFNGSYLSSISQTTNQFKPRKLKYPEIELEF